MEFPTRGNSGHRSAGNHEMSVEKFCRLLNGARFGKNGGRKGRESFPGPTPDLFLPRPDYLPTAARR